MSPLSRQRGEADVNTDRFAKHHSAYAPPAEAWKESAAQHSLQS